VVPGAPDKSMLITAIRQTTEIKMPKNGHLTDAQIDDLTAWVKDGAVWPVEKTSAQAGGYPIRPDQKHFWSFQPLAKPEPPKTKDTAWPANNIDRFVLAKLEREGLKPVADKYGVAIKVQRFDYAPSLDALSQRTSMLA
jgi:hypothetical protein